MASRDVDRTACPQLCVAVCTVVPRLVGRRRQVTGSPAVDSSRSCPQGCAQVGEISCAPGHIWSRRSAVPTAPSSPHLCTDLRKHGPYGLDRRPSAELGTTWGRPGDVVRTGRGRRRRPVHSRRDVHVSTTGRRSFPTPGAQPRSAADLRGGLPSPESTPVMTRMREIYLDFLEPQTGWGSCAWRVKGGCREEEGFPPAPGNRHDEHAPDRSSTAGTPGARRFRVLGQDPGQLQGRRRSASLSEARAELGWVER